MEADQVKAEADVKSRPLNHGYTTIALTENEVLSARPSLENGVVVELRFETERPMTFLTLGGKVRFRNLYLCYGWLIKAWRPRDESGRTVIVCGFPEKIYGKKRATAVEPKPMYR